ncbi:MAG: hypothetical protein AAF639_31175 [Chloroflexota bacterium]
MTVLQIEQGIRQLKLEDQLQILSWLAQYVRQRIFAITSPAETSLDEETIDTNNLEYPLAGTLLKYDDPFEPVAVDDWEVLQ